MSLTKLRRFGMVAAATGALTAGAFTPGMAARAAAPSHSESSEVVGGLHGVAHVEHKRTATARHAPSQRDRGVRVAPRSATADAAASSRAPSTSGQAAATAIGNLLRNFNGTSSRDSMEANYGLEFEPPDQGLCVGNGFVLEPVNSAYNIYRQDGTKIRGPFNVNDLFNEGGEEFTSDPRCHYDPLTKRWFAIILFLNSSFTSGHLDVAVSVSDDPTGFWREYRFNTDNDGTGGTPSHHGCPCFGDQPLLGIDQFNLYISTNEFSLVGPAFNGAQVYAISKSDLVNGEDADFALFENLRNGNAQATSLQPAITNGASEAEYFMDSFGIDSTGQEADNRIGVWAMTHREAVDTGGSPVLSHVVIQSEPYALPPAAIQKGSKSRLESNDDRMQQVQFIGGTLWGELGTAIHIPGDNRVRAGAAWFAVRPTLQGDAIKTAVIQKQGYVAQKGNYLLFPAMAADAAGNAAMVFTLSGADLFPSAAYAVLAAGASEFGPVRVAAPGTGPYDKRAGRWGDYSWAVLDRAADAVWLATEYIPPKSSQTPDGRRNWGTRVLEVGLS